MSKKKSQRRQLIRRSRKKSPLVHENESRLLLDQFTELDLLAWKALGKKAESFAYDFFYALESQRAQHHDELCISLQKAGSVSYHLDNWVRIVDHKFTLEPLSWFGSLKWVGGRFNYGEAIDSHRFEPFPALYLASDTETAYREKFVLKADESSSGLSTKDLTFQKENSYTIFSLKGKLHNLFDLTKTKNLVPFVKIIQNFDLDKKFAEVAKELKIKPPRLLTTPEALLKSFLDENWRHMPVQNNVPSNPQIFGKLLFKAGFEGVLYQSTKNHRGRCIAVFPSNLSQDSKIQLQGEVHKDVRLRTLDSESYKERVFSETPLT